MKFYFVLSSICFPLVFYDHGAVAFNTNPRNESNRYLSSLQIIRKYGYPAESHIVQTADGYLLEMHRIPHGLNPDVKKKGPPIFMQHGLLGSSVDFLMLGANQSIGFLLADLGYDVWFGNARGNTYSTAHVSLTPKDNKFWDFSWHESGIYDIPAELDFIRNYTKQEKVIYVGFSMGTTMFFVLTTMLPEYNQRIELSLLMAVVGYVEHIKSPLIRLLEPVASKVKFLVDLISNGAFFPHSGAWELITRIICDSLQVGTKLCSQVIYVLIGQDPAELNQTLLDILLGHYPAGYSIKGVYHYSQLLKSGKFRQYDYGPKGNSLKYGSPTPPDYPVENISVPMYFYEGQNDYLSTLPDVKKLSKRLPTLRDIRVIDYPKFNHLDFVISENVTELVNYRLINDLESFYNQRQNRYILK